MNIFKEKVMEYAFRQLLLTEFMETIKNKSDNRVITPKHKEITELKSWYFEHNPIVKEK